MLPSRSIGLTRHGLRRVRPTSPRLHGIRQLSQRSSSRNLLFSKTPSRPIRPPLLPVGTAGRANISLWPWSSKKEGLGFTPPPVTREGTPDTSSISANKHDFVTDTQDVAASASGPSQSPEATNVVNTMTDPSPLPLADESLLDTLQSPIVSEDHYGFLREMGLNYGFPYITNMLECIMESVHVYAGTEWWATIALSAIAVRLIMVVPMAIGSHHTAKLELIKPYTEEAREKLTKAKESNDPLAMRKAQKEVSELMKAVGYKMGWPIAPMILQGMFGYGAFKLVRAMTALPVPGLETGGALWFLDLTVRDPLFILPVAMGLILHLIGRMGGEMGSSSLSAGMRKVMMYIMPGVLVAFTSFQPAALQVSFLAAMTWGAGQGYLFRRAWFRKFFGMELLRTNVEAREIATQNPHQSLNAAPAQGKPARTLRSVSRIPLRYEAPRARAQREMAVYHPPKETEMKAPGKAAPPSVGLLESLVSTAQEKWNTSKEKLTPSPATAKQQRAAEYERRRRAEKKYEAETRRQGRQ